MDAVAVDTSVDADHQVEWQFEFPAALGQEPEDAARAVERAIDRHRREVRRQRDGARLCALFREMLEQLRDRRTQSGRIADLDARGPGQSLADGRMIELEDQVIRPETGDIALGVEAL